MQNVRNRVIKKIIQEKLNAITIVLTNIYLKCINEKKMIV